MSGEFNEKKPPGAYIEQESQPHLQDQDIEKQEPESQQKEQQVNPQASTTISSIYTGSGFAQGPETAQKLEASGNSPIPDEDITDIPSRGGLYKVQTLFDRVLPERRRYCGHSRRYCLFVLGLVMLAILVLIITLSVALTRGKHSMPRTNNAPGAPQRGQITFYDPGLGSCGQHHGNSNNVAALSVAMWSTGTRGSNPNNNSNCGRSIMITNVNGVAVSQMVTVADRCVGCAIGDLDVSRSVFAAATNNNMGLGRTSVEWHFVT